MWIIEFFENFSKGRGFFPILIIILSWTYTIVLFGVLIIQFLLYIFRIKYYNPEFNHSVTKKVHMEKQKDE
jgi:hypothetical protein